MKSTHLYTILERQQELKSVCRFGTVHRRNEQLTSNGDGQCARTITFGWAATTGLLAIHCNGCPSMLSKYNNINRRARKDAHLICFHRALQIRLVLALNGFVTMVRNVKMMKVYKVEDIIHTGKSSTMRRVSVPSTL
jgi:hypothetical protein